ncbi:BapA prefix-like domain-containing protein [Neorhizobium sp. BT27B]|uniref:BapA/Bap/LapF family prefix-like domain-containing protein n=1 Tax=Neorhizobium sp. BT27B TaxID=3142625 RepID=UPI003D28CF3D
MVAVVSDKVSGETSTVATNEISITRPSTIKLKLSPKDISATSRSGSDLIINLTNGEQIRIDGFFTGEGDKRSELILEDEFGNLWNGEYTDAFADLQFEPLSAVDQMVGGAAAAGAGSAFSILGPLALAGAALAAVGAGGGGGGGNNGGEPGTPAPGAPAVSLGNGDGFLNAQETAGGSVVVSINLAGTGAVAGNTLTVNGTTVTLTDAQIAAGVVEINVPAPADGQTLTVTASLTDANGNTSPVTTISAVVDTTAPGLPSVSVGNGDNVISGGEVTNGQVKVTVNLAGSGAVAGDTLVVNGTATVLTAAQIAAGVAETTVPVPADGQTLTVTASLTDAAGNSSPAATISAQVDTTAPTAPVLTVGNGDNIITGAEISNGAVTVRIDIVGTGAVAGDTVTVNGSAIVLTGAQIAAGFVTTTVTAPARGETLNISASLTDAAGNVSPPATLSAVVDPNLPGTPTVTVGNGDAYINAAEAVGGVVSVSISLANTGAVAGNTLTVNGNTIVLTGAQIAAGLAQTTLPVPADGETLTVTASFTDSSGNTSPATTISALVDTIAPNLPGLTLGDGNGPIGSGEISGGSVTVSVNLAGTGAVAGDTLIVGGIPVTLTAAQIQAGTVTVAVTAPADGQPLFVSATLTDPAGNSSPIATASALVDTTAPGLPTVTLGSGGPFLGPNDITGGVVDVTIGLAGTGAAAGDILAINGDTFVLSAADINAGTVTKPIPAPAEGQTLTVTATLTDTAGNPSPAATVTAIVDTTPPGTPGIILGNGDGVIEAGELVNGSVPVRISLAGTNAAAGDTLTVGSVSIVLTAAQVAAGVVDTSVPALAQGAQLTVSASLQDAAGNSSGTANALAVMDTNLLGTPSMTLGDGDAYLNAAEVINNLVTVTFNITGTGAAAGDTLTVNGTPITLTAGNISTGTVSTQVTAPADGLTLSVTAQLTSTGGYTSPTVTASALVDISPPGTPVLTLGDGDAYIKASEVTNGTVNLRITITGTGAAEGDTLMVNGSPIVLTAANITDGFVAMTVPAPATGQALTAHASLVDIAGNSSPIATASADVDTVTPGQPAVTIGNGDGFINGSEITNNQVEVFVDLANTGAAVGDRLTVAGTTIVLTSSMISNGVFVNVNAVPDGQALSVSASITDIAGNTSPVTTVTANVDTTAPNQPAVTLGDGNAYINAADVVNGAVSVNVSLAGTGAAIGDKVNIDGTIITLTAAHISANAVLTTVPVPATGGTLTVNVFITDAAGDNSPTATVSAPVDTDQFGTPVITIGNGDPFVIANEVTGGNVAVSINISGTGALAGDSLIVNGQTIVLNAQQIALGHVDTSVLVPTDGSPLTVTANLTDTAGNTSPVATASAAVDLDVPTAPGVILGTNGDLYINAAEAAGGVVSVRISILGTGAVAGDSLIVNGARIVLTSQEVIAGVVTTTVSAAANGQSLIVTAQLQDVAGNESVVTTVTALTDTIAPTAPVLTLGNGDGFISIVEVSNNAVALRIDISATDAIAGDTLTVNGNAYVLTATDITNRYVDTTVGLPAVGNTLEVDAFLTDIAGNTSAVVEVNATVDITAPTSPIVTIGSGNGLLGIADVTGGVAQVSVDIRSTGAVAGDILTVGGQSIVLTASQISNGIITTTVPILNYGQPLQVTAVLTDAVGNASAPTTASATIDITAPGIPLVTLGDGDAFINASEVTAGRVEVRISLAGTGAVAGDTLLIDGQATILTAQDITDGLTTGIVRTVPVVPDGDPFAVAVSLRDQAGNGSPTATVTASVDTQAPLAPTVQLGDGNNFIIASELVGGAVPVSISLAGTGAAIGDTLTVNGTTIVLDATQIATQLVTLTLPAPGDGQTLNVTTTITDAAGNTSIPVTEQAVMDTDILGAPTLTIGNGDGFITATEIIGGNVTVRVGLAGTGAAAGDTVTVDGQLFVLTPGDITAGYINAPVLAPLEGQSLTVTASLTGFGGNPSPDGTVTAVVDTVAPPPVTVTIGNGDGYIVSGEISGGTVAVAINITGAAAGDTLTINGTSRVLTAADITAGTVQTNLSAPASGQSLTVEASLTDPAGNISTPTTVSALVDTIAPDLPVITIGNGDGFILPAEIVGNNVSVAINIRNTGAVAGDTLIINGVANVLTTQNIIDGVVNRTILAPANNSTLTINASLVDAAGNSSGNASANALVDTTVPTAPTITLGNGDAYINAAEVSAGRVAVSINIGTSGAAVGDTLNVNGTTIVLTAAHISSGTVATTVAVPVSGQTLAVTAFITDTSGNISLPATANALVDTIVPLAPSLSLGSNGDAYIGIAEVNSGLVNVSVSLAGTGAVAGDRLNVNGTFITLTSAQVLAGTVTTSVAAPANGSLLTVNASLIDIAGNTSPIVTGTATVDLVAPTAPIVTLGTNGDAYINLSEVTAGSVAVSVNLAGTGAVAGDRLTINGTTTVLSAAQAAGIFTTTVPAPGSGSTLTVNAILTDAAGNAAPLTTAIATVDTTPPVAPTVGFVVDSGTIGDGISTNGAISVSGIEPGARWEYSTNGGTNWLTGSGTGFTLGVGSHNVLVRQIDVAGNATTRTLGPVTIINLVANDDASTINLNITPSTVTQPKQTGAVGGVLNLGLLGNAVDVSLLSGQSPLKFTVANNTTQQVSVKGTGAALAALTLVGEQNYDLIVYRVENGQTQAQQVHVITDWLTFNPGILGLLLPSWSASSTTLPQFEGGGTYYLVLANPGGLLNLSALANMTVETTSNVVTDYRNVNGSVAGNVLTGDATVTGTIVSSVDQAAVGPTGLVIHGDHGTLTISRGGAYSYVADPLFTGADGSTDVFTYTITSPDGSTSTANLTITADYAHGPQALMSASIEELNTDDMFSMAMSFDSDALDPDSASIDLDSINAPDTDGTDFAPDQPVFAELQLDQGGQEVDLAALGLSADIDPSQTPDAPFDDAAFLTARIEITEDLPMDPFPVSLLPEDQLHTSVI